MIICELAGSYVRLRELVGTRSRSTKPTVQEPFLNPYGCLLGLLLSSEPAECVLLRGRLFCDLSQFFTAIWKEQVKLAARHRRWSVRLSAQFPADRLIGRTIAVLRFVMQMQIMAHLLFLWVLLQHFCRFAHLIVVGIDEIFCESGGKMRDLNAKVLVIGLVGSYPMTLHDRDN